MPNFIKIGQTVASAGAERGPVGDKTWFIPLHVIAVRYDTRCYFNVRSKADISRLNLPHGILIYRTELWKLENQCVKSSLQHMHLLSTRIPVSPEYLQHIDRLWHYQQIWHKGRWHQRRACSVLEGLWEGTYGCAGLCAERWEVPGTSAEHREQWHWKNGSFTFQLVSSQKVNDNYWPSPTSYATEGHIQRAFYATYMQVNCLGYFPLNPQDYRFTMESKCLVPKRCYRNLPDEVSLKCNCVKCAPRSCPCRERNVRCWIFCKCQANSQCKTLMVLFWQSRCGSYGHRESEKWF